MIEETSRGTSREKDNSDKDEDEEDEEEDIDKYFNEHIKRVQSLQPQRQPIQKGKTPHP